MSRREYPLSIIVNGILINKVVIDPHYEEKHNDVINDEIIIELVKKLDNGEFDSVASKDGFDYYVSDRLALKGKLYKLIWLLEENEIYVGVVNAHRTR